MTDSRKKRRKKRPLLVLFIIIAAIAGLVAVTHISYFDVTGIAVIGNEEITDEEVMHLSKIEVGESIFDANPIFVKHRIKKNLYIDKVSVRWNMPNHVQISISEKTCLAQFDMNGKYAVTDDEAKVLEVSTEMKKATLVDGLKVLAAERKKKIKVDDEKKLEKALEFIALTDERELFFKRISIDGNRIDAYVFDELVCSGKYEDVVSCISSKTLESVVYDLYQKGIEKGHVNVYADNYCFFTK